MSKFSVNDHVRVTDPKHPLHDRVGVVGSVHREKHWWAYWVQFSDTFHAVPEHHLVLAEEVPFSGIRATAKIVDLEVELDKDGRFEADLAPHIERLNHIVAGGLMDADENPMKGSVTFARVDKPSSPEVRSVSSTGAEKGTKAERFDLLPAGALSAVARHYAVGAEKYSAHNWRKGYEWSKSYAALQRHANLFWSGQDDDEETGTPHMAAVAFHALSLLTFMVEQPGFDDRYRAEGAS